LRVTRKLMWSLRRARLQLRIALFAGLSVEFLSKERRPFPDSCPCGIPQCIAYPNPRLKYCDPQIHAKCVRAVAPSRLVEHAMPTKTHAGMNAKKAPCLDKAKAKRPGY
jgi:hypothetical protein